MSSASVRFGTKNGVRTCSGYNTLSMMLRGGEAYE